MGNDSNEERFDMKKALMSAWSLLFLLFSTFVFSGNTYADPDGQLACKYLNPIELGFLQQHVKYSALDKMLEGRVVDQYIKKLDRSKIYFQTSDVDKIKQLMNNVFEALKKGDCTSLDEVQKLYVQRVKDRAEFAKKFLGKTYKFDKSVEIVVDMDKKPYAKSIDEINELFKNYIHFQIASYLSTDMKLEEAKTNVIKNYDRQLKRVLETKTDDVYASYLDAFALGLDPHSSFFSREVLEDFEISMSLSLEGIGATLSSQDGFTVVEALVPGGAAARSGMMKPQDKIIAVAEGESGKSENVIEMDLRDVVRKIRGKKGTKVKLTVLRKEGEGKGKFDVTLVRDKIKLEDEAAAIKYLDKEVGGVKKKIGIIEFPSFYSDSRKGGRSSAEDMKKIIADAVKSKVDGLVLDLSTNGGGSLDDAVKISGLFFKTGNVVKQSSKDESKSEQALADIDSNVDWTGPLVVLTSRISASASEIVSGTLQDYKRAVIVGGDHTFGKGSVQSVMPIPNSLGAIKVTVGMFFVPGGNSTQHRGVSADVPLPGAFSNDEVGEKSLDYSLPPKTIPSFVSKEAFVKEGSGTWKEVNLELIKSLKEKSVGRVDKSEDFKKIIAEAKKNSEKSKLLKLSEVLKDKDSKQKKAKEKKNASKADKDKEYLKRADIQEATNVLADLISLQK